MTNQPSPTSDLWPPHAHDAAGEIAVLSETVRATVAMAAQLAASGRRVDVTGLDQTVGVLCAKALDLSASEGRAARIGLIELLAKLDVLGAALRSADAE